MTEKPITWILIDKFCDETGYTQEAVLTKRRRGIWPDGIITMKQGGRIHVNRKAYDKWVEKGCLSLVV